MPMAAGAIAAVAAVEAANQAAQQSRRRLSAVVKVMTKAKMGAEELTTTARATLDHSNAMVKLTGHGDKTLALYHDGEMLTLGSETSCCSRDSGTDVALSRMLLDVACGDKHVVGASEQGYLLTWGEVCDSRSKPRREKETANVSKVVQSLLHKRIVQVVCGASHSFALAEDGDVFSWGIGRSGALGHGLNAHEQTFDSVLSPMEVLALKGRRVVQISCGDLHTAVLLQSGELLTCGQREYGRLGRQIAANGKALDSLDDEYSSWFAPVIFPHEGVKCTYVACGASHTLAVAGAHELYAFGWNSSGQLGVGDCRDRFIPTRVAYFDAVGTLPPLTIASVAAGKQHSLVSSNDGRIFAWGNDEMGQCGLSSCPQIYTLPHLVTSLIGLRVTQLAAATSETLERMQPIQYAQLCVKDDTERRAQVFERARRYQLERAAAARRRKPPVDPATETLVKLLELQALVDQDAALDAKYARARRPQTARVASSRCSEEKNGRYDQVRCSSASMVRQARLAVLQAPLASVATALVQKPAVVSTCYYYATPQQLLRLYAIMTLLDEYRRSIQSRTASRSNQDRKRRSRQLAPLNGSESGRRTPEIPEKVSAINQKAVQLAARQRTNNRKLRASRAFEGVSPSRLETVERPDKVISNQEDSAPSRTQTSHESQRKPVGKPTALEQLILPHRPEPNNTVASTLTDVPLQLLQGARVDLRRWSVIVSDQTLRRIAAHNHRITSTSLKAQKLHGLLADNESLLLTGADAITDAGLAAIALAVPNLKELAIAGAVRVTDASLRVLSEYCLHLERLDLSALSNVRGAGLAALVDRCGASLTHLSLADCPQLGDWVLRRCFYAAPRLTHLNLSRCPQVNDVLIETLVAQCPHLRKLELRGCLMISDRAIVRIARSSPLLEYIALDRPIGVRGVEHLTDSSCSALGGCPNLRVVLLAGSSALTDAGVQWMVSRCSQLTRLDLTGAIGLTDATCAALGANCPELRSLKINGVKGISDVGLRLLAAGCTKLELVHTANLYLVSDGSNRDFGLEGLRAIASKCYELQDLNLSGCFQLQERALVAIGASCCCQKLTKLDLSGVRRCDDRMLRAIAKYGSSITQFVVAGCDRVGDIGLKYLASTRADQLELLDLTGCRLVSDTGLNVLCDAFQRPKLAHLVLADCPLITQDPIARLAFACPQLLTLNVHGCRISARVLQSLSSSWPFGELRLPRAGTAGNNTQVGIFPAPRAKDRRYVAEFCTSWAAAATIQNLFRARVARRQGLIRREIALQHAVARKLQSIWRGRQARREALVLKIKFSRLEHCATLIQRRYRATRQARRVQNEMRGIYEKQLLQAAVLVQRRFRAMRAGREARRLVARRRREFMCETQAAIKVQRHFRRRVHRNKLRLMQAQKLARSRRERSASIQIQRRYRGHQARRLAFDLREEQRRFFELQQRCAVRIQAQFRRLHALRKASRRRNAIIEREMAATKLQSAFRARRGRQAAGLLALAKFRNDQDLAARRLQRHWRARRDQLAFIIVAEARRIRNQERSEAAVVIQRFVRKFLVRRRARNVVRELLEVQQRAEEMKRWASTLVQSYYRRHQAYGRVREERKIQRTRWKQLVDTYNQHGAGHGAPFYFNQVNGEIRWRLPRDLLSLTVRPACAQCETPQSATFECATCSEFYCDHCDVVVHGGGKRRQHNKRKLFDYYGRRRDYADGEFPSIWPSEILQDASRGYDFENLAPRDNYQDMLWEISQFVPVSTGNWDDEIAVSTAASSPAVALAFVTRMSESTSVQTNGNHAANTDADGLERPAAPLNHLLYREKDFDEHGVSLWESFYDYHKESIDTTIASPSELSRIRQSTRYARATGELVY
ncbi:Leucine-rich repeat domain, L domain-like [Phytophthora cactorum]|nr:Leucine-rich repeat domain, L domain-like [Phytophthora cactorum]